MKQYHKNPRKITDAQLQQLKENIQELGDLSGIVHDLNTDEIISGNQRSKVININECEIEIVKQYDEPNDQGTIAFGFIIFENQRLNYRQVRWNDKQREKACITANALGGDWDYDILKADWDLNNLNDWGLNIFTSDFIETEKQTNKVKRASLKDEFGIIPFSVLDTRNGDWIKRRNQWIDMGIKSEVGRDELLTYAKSVQSPNIYEQRNKLRDILGRDPKWDEIISYCEEKGIPVMGGTSIFDPVLCEFCYRFFNVKAGVVLDPFAGGSVRGIVASRLGMKYNGVDLRQKQIDSNVENAKEVLSKNDIFPNWVCGDSNDIDKHLNGVEADMIFTCPPYADLEVYSDDERDLSNMDHNDFLISYKNIIRKSAEMLKTNRFAVIVVGEVRDKNGYYRNFVSDTITAAQQAGLKYYNELILVTNTATLAIRIKKSINTTRKVGKHHQNVLVFYKPGDGKIKDDFPAIDISKEETL